MSAYWILWAAFTVVNAALLVASWRLAKQAKRDLAGALESMAESGAVLADARRHLDRAKRLLGGAA